MTNREIDNLFEYASNAILREFVRPATAAEIADYKAVEAITDGMDEDTFEDFLTTVNAFAWWMSTDDMPRKAAYMRLYRKARKYGLTVKQCVTWSFID